MGETLLGIVNIYCNIFFHFTASSTEGAVQLVKGFAGDKLSAAILEKKKASKCQFCTVHCVFQRSAVKHVLSHVINEEMTEVWNAHLDGLFHKKYRFFYLTFWYSFSWLRYKTKETSLMTIFQSDLFSVYSISLHKRLICSWNWYFHNNLMVLFFFYNQNLTKHCGNVAV